MQRMADAGAKVARWWVFADGRYSPEFNRDGTVSGLDASFLPDIDRALRRADAAGIRLILTVIDGSMWKSAVRGGSLQFGGRSKMVTDPAVRQTFLDRALRPLVEHVAASPYRDRVIAYDIVNEPEAQMRGYWGGVNLDPSLVKEFVRKCAETIHSHGGGALATVGSAMPWYAPTWKGLGLDFYQVHYYPWMDPGLPGSGLPVLSRLELDKPCIVGEFPTNCRSYEIGGATAYGAQWYLDKIASRGYAGALAWSFWIDDTATDWRSFKPVFASWAVSFEPIVGPG
jgi:hypothetical protein